MRRTLQVRGWNANLQAILVLVALVLVLGAIGCQSIPAPYPYPVPQAPVLPEAPATLPVADVPQPTTPMGLLSLTPEQAAAQKAYVESLLSQNAYLRSSLSVQTADATMVRGQYAKLKAQYDSLLALANKQGPGDNKASVKTGIGTWMKVLGALCLAAVIPLAYFGMGRIAIGVGLGGVGLIAGGIFVNTAERIEQTLADHLGWVIAALVALLVTAVALAWKYRFWFLKLTGAVKSEDAVEVARANADSLSPSDHAQQKALLESTGTLLPTAPEVKPST